MRGSLNAPRASFPILLALLAGAGCELARSLDVAPPPVVQQQQLAATRPPLLHVAVAPFHATIRPVASVPIGVNADAASVESPVAFGIAERIAGQLGREGLQVDNPGVVRDVFEQRGEPVPSLDARRLAEVASKELGATSVLIGRVTRYRDREGSAAGASRAASVSFEVSLHEAPSGRRLWMGKFDETQLPLSSGVFRVRSYPGGGTYWLSAKEMATWGADAVAKALVQTE